MTFTGETKKEYYREYYKKNKEKYAKYLKKYANSEKGKKKIKEYREKNKDKFKAWLREYEKKRKEKDPTIHLQKLFSVRLRRIVKKYLKTGKVVWPKDYVKFKDLPKDNMTMNERISVDASLIDYDKIIKKLEPIPKDFDEKYEIDHIKPVCMFNLHNPEEFKKCYTASNLQILTKEENRKKGSKYI